jgi:uncharacterized membrane protein YidH (DUF202 family)
MPLSNRHRQQKRKNIALFVVLLALILLVYGITLMRMGFSAQ